MTSLCRPPVNRVFDLSVERLVVPAVTVVGATGTAASGKPGRRREFPVLRPARALRPWRLGRISR